MDLIDTLIKSGWLKSPRIIKAFREIKRIDFLPVSPLGGPGSPRLGGPNDLKGLAEANTALPIGYGQTISQPLVVAFMIEQLDPQSGDKILDIGSGSGWTTALLSYIVGSKGKVIALEIIPELKEFGEKNVSKYNFIKEGRTEFLCADGSKGYEKEAPFDRILASASGGELPRYWKEQLKIDGRIVAPIRSSIWVFIKKSEKEFEELEYPGFAFVPLITDNLKHETSN